MALSRYCKLYRHPEDEKLRTLFSTKTMTVLDVSSDVVHDIENGNLSKSEKRTLDEYGLLAEDSESERQEMLSFIENFNSDSETFNAVVVLGLDCNLACRYCFEGKRKGKFFMSEDTAESLVGFVKSQDFDKTSEINIVFYGGEPLLSMDTILRISENLLSFSKKKKLKYASSFITNGTLLTRRVVEELKPLGLKKAGVTLDGPREVHDLFRPFKSGKGSFDTIVGNVQEVCSMIDVQIGGNYARGHYREFPGLLDYFLERGITPEKISSVNFGPVISERDEFPPPDFHDGCMTTDEPWLADATIFLREETLKRGFRTRELLPFVCSIERRNIAIVNFDGTLYKCPGFIGRKDYCVGDLKSGMIDGRAMYNLDNWKNEECLACSYLPLCFGGCRYMKLARDGNMRGVDCKKQFLDKTLKALVLQDVRYGL